MSLVLFSGPLRAEVCGPKVVILVSVDGLGSHLYSENALPNIKTLAREGLEVSKATTTELMKTLPGHASMISGVLPDKHKIVSNELDESLKPLQVPTLFELTRKAGLRSALITGKRKIAFIMSSRAVDSVTQPGAYFLGDYFGRFPSQIDRAFVKELNAGAHFLFLHYAAGDTMGHAFRWESWPQRVALKSIDKSIGRVRAAADRIIGAGRYAILLTADHGGHGGSHGQRKSDGEAEDRDRDFYIPWIYYGPAAKLLEKDVSIRDTAPTLASLLSLQVPPEYKWDGKSKIELKCSVENHGKVENAI